VTHAHPHGGHHGHDAPHPSDEVVGLHRLCVEYDGEHILEDVDVSIGPGELVALLGPNGSGKTTLVRTILGLQPYSHGRVTLFGTTLDRFRDWGRIALVPQRLPGSSTIPVSVWEAVLSGLISPRRRWRPFRRTERQAAQEALVAVGLWERRHERLDTLSGGQQRRVLIARALATGADLLLFDEPTAGLDSQNLARLAEVLADLHRSGKTIIIVTHELTGIASLITRAIVLGSDTDGSVAFDGPPPVPGFYLHDHVHHHESADEAPGAVGLQG
jgi:zinc transport system ATP-binding protein